MMEEYVGVVKLFVGNRVPQHYLECNGQLLDIRIHNTLYHVIGTKFGGEEGVNYNIPKLDPPHEGMKYIICMEGIFPSTYY